MFIKLELWEENPRPDGQTNVVGNCSDAYLDMKELRYRHLAINACAVTAFEHIRIWTIGRPGTTASQGDCLNGVRLRLSDGTQYVVIDLKSETFEDLLTKVKTTPDAVVDAGRSPYMEKWVPSASAA